MLGSNQLRTMNGFFYVHGIGKIRDFGTKQYVFAVENEKLEIIDRKGEKAVDLEMDIPSIQNILLSPVSIISVSLEI